MSTFKKHIYIGEKIPLDKINVFQQVRKTFDKDELLELANDIAINGILQPSIVAKLNKESFLVYKNMFEELTNAKIDDVVSHKDKNGEEFFYCLIAGERRYRGHLILWQEGCEECKEKALAQNKKLEHGQCYAKHFKNDLIEIRSCLNIDPFSAKSIQFRENNHVKPPVSEEAEAYRDYFIYLRKKDHRLSYKGFAKIVGVSSEKISKALHFCELPEIIREAVKVKFISYSHGLEFRKILELDECYADEKRKEKMVREMLDYLLTRPKTTLTAFKIAMSTKINNLNQASLFEQNTFELDLSRRKVVDRHLVDHLTTGYHYVQKVETLNKAGKLGKKKAFSGISPSKQVPKFLFNLEEVIPGFMFTEKQRKIIQKMNFET